MNIRTAIEHGDLPTLERLLAAEPARADEPVRWGPRSELASHPIHFVCDMLFDGTLARGNGAPLVRALIRAGADIDFAGGDPLNAATSLGAVEVADLLLDAGARVDLRGSLGETALHWAATIGSLHMVQRLVAAGAPLDVLDDRWKASPLGWALHGWDDQRLPAREAGHPGVVACLVRSGAFVDPRWIESAMRSGRADVLHALSCVER